MTYVRFVSLTICLQGLVVLLIATFELLRPFQLEHMFLCIKVFLLLIGLQGIVLTLLLRWDIIRKSPLCVEARGAARARAAARPLAARSLSESVPSRAPHLPRNPPIARRYVNATAYEMWNAVLLVLESPMMMRYTIYAFPARDLSQVNPLAELNRRAEDSPIQLLLLGSDDDVSFKNVVHAMWHGERQQSERHIRELSQHGAVDSSWKHPRRSESDIDDQI